MEPDDPRDPRLELQALLRSPTADSVRALYPHFQDPAYRHRYPEIGVGPLPGNTFGRFATDTDRLAPDYPGPVGDITLNRGLDFTNPLALPGPDVHEPALPVLVHELGHAATRMPEADPDLADLRDEIVQSLMDETFLDMIERTYIVPSLSGAGRRMTPAEVQASGIDVDDLMDKYGGEYLARMMGFAFHNARRFQGEPERALHSAELVESAYPGMTRVQQLVLDRLDAMSPGAGQPEQVSQVPRLPPRRYEDPVPPWVRAGAGVGRAIVDAVNPLGDALGIIEGAADIGRGEAAGILGLLGAIPGLDGLRAARRARRAQRARRGATGAIPGDPEVVLPPLMREADEAALMRIQRSPEFERALEWRRMMDRAYPGSAEVTRSLIQGDTP